MAMELIAHSCSAFYQEGHFAVLKLDATNGFQERARLHQKVLQTLPLSSTPLSEVLHRRIAVLLRGWEKGE